MNKYAGGGGGGGGRAEPPQQLAGGGGGGGGLSPSAPPYSTPMVGISQSDNGSFELVSRVKHKLESVACLFLLYRTTSAHPSLVPVRLVAG